VTKNYKEKNYRTFQRGQKKGKRGIKRGAKNRVIECYKMSKRRAS
jgi:hypothetical protein